MNRGRAGNAISGRCVRSLLLLFLIAACESGRETRAAPGDWRGTRLDPPVARPSFTLTDTDGAPYEFHARTKGAVTLLFFGYTNCPDVCPVHMANLGRTLERFPLEVRNRVRVVFISTDPERDTPERIRAWLDQMGDGFVGLRGTIEEVNRIQTDLGLPPAAAAKPGDAAPDDYTVGHAAQILAFTADDSAHFAYPFGVRHEDWLHDLPRLVAFEPR